MSGQILNLDAGNPVSYPGTTGFPTQVEYLIVAGGGSGGTARGGGGGAGGFLTSFVNITPQTYNIVVGAGGVATAFAAGDGNNGSNSSAFGLTAIGGGAGRRSVTSGNSGGSGGGAGNSGGVTFVGGNGTTGQGNAGGNNNGQFDGGGGGGGAGAPGGVAPAGAGGGGLSSSITGTAVFYAGGGGGGGVGGGGAGGVGGGGAGGVNLNGFPGLPNTGGGGGGAWDSTGGAGGSGIVIVRYLGVQQALGGTVTTAGGYTIHTFTASGTFAPLTWRDISGQNNNGTLVNAPGFNSANQGILIFNGTSQSANLGNVLSMTTAGQQLTIGAWIFPTRSTNYIVGRGQNNANDGQYSFRMNLGVLTLSIFSFASSTVSYNIGTVPLNQWSYVFFSHTFGNSSSTIGAINGVVQGSWSGNGNAISDQTNTSLEIAHWFGTPTGTSDTYWFQGNISNVQLYNRALTANEMLQNFNALRGRFGI